MVAQVKDYIDDFMSLNDVTDWTSFLADEPDWTSILGDGLPEGWESISDDYDWDSLLNGGGDSGSWGSWLSGISRLFGGGTGPGGGTGGGGGNLLSLLALLGGGINQTINTDDATDAMLRGNQAAEDVIREQIGRSGEPFQPYTTAGADAVSRLSAMPDSALADKYGPLANRYKPLGSGRGIALGTLAKGGK